MVKIGQNVVVRKQWNGSSQNKGLDHTHDDLNINTVNTVKWTVEEEDNDDDANKPCVSVDGNKGLD